MAQASPSDRHSIPGNGVNAVHFEHQGHPNPLVDFNARLQSEADPARVNETYLETRIDELQAIPVFSPEIHGLTLARITELALICAGNYADSCEYAAAGDLMINPPQVLVYLRGRDRPTEKVRHEKLTVQFRRAGMGTASMIHWMMENTFVEIRKQPILTRLRRMIEDVDVVSEDYLASVDRRMEQIADTMGFLSAWNVASAEELHQKLKTVRPSEAAFIENALCRFDRRLFDEMGADIDRLQWRPGYRSRFIRPREWYSRG